MKTRIMQGQRVYIKPEWQDEGDQDFEWFAVSDESMGRVDIAARMPDFTFQPWTTVNRDMIESETEHQALGITQ